MTTENCQNRSSYLGNEKVNIFVRGRNPGYFECGEFGHIRKDCQKEKNEEKEEEKYKTKRKRKRIEKSVGDDKIEESRSGAPQITQEPRRKTQSQLL